MSVKDITVRARVQGRKEGVLVPEGLTARFGKKKLFFPFSVSWEHNKSLVFPHPGNVIFRIITIRASSSFFSCQVSHEVVKNLKIFLSFDFRQKC